MGMSDLEDFLPCLAISGYKVTSSRTDDYNCFAWAAEQDDCWWSPDSEEYFWLEGAPKDLTLDGMVKTYGLLGYEISESENLEYGFQKIAIYMKDGKPSHAARQLLSGKWTSKLGGWEDIEHELVGLEGSGEHEYGYVQQILKRPI